MPSVIQGFEYDIFISYRHNDNRSGWVTDFVNALQEELAATIKEPINIYFDKSPHNGLLEMHNVNKSLEGKIKCLIFIPIISQTYCDPKSFAWQNEFCVFNKLSKEDPYGRDIKLNNGNVMSRILPIKIHDLDDEDKEVIEREIEHPLRAIEFIFRAPGVNRPLTVHDNPEKNLTYLNYRDQINKVANSIKQLINVIKKPDGFVQQVNREENTSSGRHYFSSRGVKWVASILILLALIFFVAYYFNPIKKEPAIGKARVMVMPFTIADSSHSYFASGITVDLVTEMGKIRSFSTISWNTSFNYTNTDKSYQEIARETQANYFLIGVVQRNITQVRINVSLIDPMTSETVWTSSWDEDESKIFDIQKQIAVEVSKELNIQLTPEEDKLLSARYRTSVMEAYDLLLRARSELRNFYNDPQPLYIAKKYLDRALTLDPNFSDALILKAYTRVELSWMEGLDPFVEFREAKSEIDRALLYNPNSSDAYAVSGLINFFFSWDMEKSRNDFEKSWQLTNYGESPFYQCNCGYIGYNIAKGDYTNAIKIIEKVEKLDPYYPFGMLERLIIFRSTGELNALKKAFHSADDSRINPFLAAYYYEVGEYGKSLEAFKKENLDFIWPSTYLANVYYKSGFIEKSDSIMQNMIARSNKERNIDFGLAVLYAARKDKENALKWYISAFEKHDFWIPYTRGDADLKLIVNEPEVQKILKSIHL
jgi:TolB-like protein